MAIKTNITDQLLWDLYSFFEKAGDIVRPFVQRKRSYGEPFGFENPIFKRYRKMKNKRAFNNLIHYLKRNNFIRVKNLQGNQAVMLTKKGADKAMRARFKFEDSKKTKRRDGKWIMIIFDIPQRHQKARNLLRSVLQNMGYKMFQQSVWVTPYDVSEKTEELLQWYSLDNYVKVFLIEKL